MKRHLEIILLASCAAALVAAPCRDAGAESLEDAVVTALNHHPSVEAALAGRDAAIEAKQEQVSGYFPKLRASAATGREYGDNATSRGLTVDRGAGYSWLHEGSLTLTQPLFDGFRTQSEVEAADARREAADISVTDVRENLALQTSLAYMSVLRANEEKDIIDAYSRKIDGLLAKIKTLVESGSVNQSDLQQAKDIRILLDNIRQESEGRLEVAGVRYAELVGHVPEGEMTAPSLGAGTVPDMESGVSYALANHPTLKGASYQADAAQSEIDVEKSALYPQLSAELSYYKKDLRDIIGGEVVDAKGLLRMNWDFSTGGEQFDRIDRRRFEYASQKAKVDEARRQVEREVRTAYTELATSSKQKETYARRVILLSDLAKTNRTQFEGGIVSLLQLLQSENQLFSAELDQVGAKYRVLAAQFGVLASIGNLQRSLNIVPASHDDRQKAQTQGSVAAAQNGG